MSAVLVLAAALALPVQVGARRSVALEPGWRADHGTLADLDGDGTSELLLALHAKGREFERRLETWRTTRDGALERSAVLALTRDVVAFAHGDVLAGGDGLGDGAEELVLFNAGGAFALRPGAEVSPVRLLATDFLWQVSDPGEAFEWADGVRDLDRDGLADLVLPEPGGFTVAVQRRAEGAEAAFGIVSHLRVPEEPPEPGERARGERRRGRAEGRRSGGAFSLELDLGVGGGDGKGGDEPREDAGPLVSIEERVPAPAWLDWDADGDLDLVLQTRATLHVWTQEAGAFAAAPRLSLALPVAAGHARELDASYSAHAVDLDRDARADYAVFAGDKASDDVRTQALFFAQAAVETSAVETGPPLFGAEGRPASVLVFAGFLQEPRFPDLDGDGFPELVVRTFRPDLIDQIRSAASETIDVELFVYRNRAGVLARRPELARRFALALDEDEGELEVEFLDDLTGDGLAELLVREQPEKVRVLSLRAAGGREGGWSLSEKPLWELGIAKDARVELVRAAPEKGPALLVLEPAQVLWVSFE